MTTQTALHHRLATLRERIDALAEGRARALGLFDLALARLGAPEEVPRLPLIEALHRDLDRVGVHTAGDAQLLRAAGAARGAAGELARGLGARALAAVDELEAALAGCERALVAQRLAPGATTALKEAWPRAARALKVADIFAAPAEDAAPFEIFARADAVQSGPPQNARVAVAQFWAERARVNVVDVVQRRRDLDAAHELLLRVGSESDRERVRALRLKVSEARQRGREAPPVKSLAELLRHVRRSARSQPQEAFRSLRGLYERAVERGDGALAEAAFAAVGAFVAAPTALRAALESDDGSHVRVLRAEPLGATPEEAYEERQLLDTALALGERSLEAFDLAAGAQRFFDVEDALGVEVLSVEAARRRPNSRRVPYPTGRLEFEQTSGFHELRDFVISDPRAVLFDVASGRQLVRAWQEESGPPEPRRVRKTSVRVYVCDASGSMHGARARLRDAILLAELNNIRVRARRGEPFDPLYFCFFSDVATGLQQVDSAAAATRAIRHLLSDSPAEGQTDITLALLQAFDSIREAQGSDPYLARATVVLVTDGEDRVDLARLREARAPVDRLEVAMSFIALGEENRDLRSLVHEQRAQGGRAFYVHLSDQEVLLARTEFDSRRRTLLPSDLPVTQVALEQLAPHLAALERVAQGAEVSLEPAPVVGPGNFDALFPAGAEEDPKAEDPELPRVTDILEAIAEASGLAPADGRARECVVLLYHLLELYQLPVPRYLRLVSLRHPKVARALGRIRVLAGPLA